MTAMTIGLFAQQAGVGVETVRYYQRRGLLERPRGDGVRHYGAGDLARLRFIRSAQSAGFTLEQIGELIALDATNDRPRARALAAERIAALETQIAALTASRDALRRLAHECGSGGEGPCPILSAFEH